MLRLITFTVVCLSLLSYQAMAANITPYGTFNYKWSHDENASGVAHDKLENNGSIIGIDISEPSIEGSSISGVAKLELGVDVDDNAPALPPNNPSNAALAFTLLGAVSVSVVFFPPNKPSNAALAFILPVGLVMPSPSLLC